MVLARELAEGTLDGGEGGGEGGGSDGGVQMREVMEVSGAGEKWGSCGGRGDGKGW
jgi:hypothetical protein